MQTIINPNARSTVNFITRSLQVIPAATENLLAHLLQGLTRTLKRPTITESNRFLHSISTTALKTGDPRISFSCPNLSLGKERKQSDMIWLSHLSSLVLDCGGCTRGSTQFFHNSHSLKMVCASLTMRDRLISLIKGTPFAAATKFGGDLTNNEDLGRELLLATG